MAPDWKQLLRWLKSSRPERDKVNPADPCQIPDNTTASRHGWDSEGSPKRASVQSGSPDRLPGHQTAVSAPPSSPPGPSRRTGGLPVNRHGIPVLRPNDDPGHLMRGNDPAAADDGSPISEKALSPKPPPAGRKRSARSRDAKLRKKTRTNRHGLPLLSDRDDLERHFEEAGETHLPAEQGTTDKVSRPDDCNLRDKNGIPVLDNCRDLGGLMAASGDASASAGEWSQDLQASLAYDARTLMKRKTGGIYPTRKLTLQERLKRYPRVQGQLDLHGATAIKAQQRTEAYVRTAHADGLFTLRIIVGKGLHSESGAVLPDVVEDRLIQLKREGLVLAYRWEKGAKRKSGAVIVYLEPAF